MWWCVERRAAEGKIRFSRKNVIFTVQTNNTIFNRETPSERAVTGTTHTHTAPPCAIVKFDLPAGQRIRPLAGS